MIASDADGNNSGSLERLDAGNGVFKTDALLRGKLEGSSCYKVDVRCRFSCFNLRRIDNCIETF